MAGPAARADGVRRFAVSVLFGVRREPASDQPGATGRRRLARCVQHRPAIRAVSGYRLPCGDCASPRPLAARVRAVRGVGSNTTRDRFDRFCATHADWLNEYALFMAVKDAHDQRPWTTWSA